MNKIKSGTLKLYNKLPDCPKTSDFPKPVRILLAPFLFLGRQYTFRPMLPNENKIRYVVLESFVFLAKCLLTATTLYCTALLIKAGIIAFVGIGTGVTVFFVARALAKNQNRVHDQTA